MSTTPILAELRCTFVPCAAQVSATRRVSAPAPIACCSFDRLVREHEPALLAFALRLCGSRSDARDLVQDALERALRRFDGFAYGTNARAWLFTILHNAFINQYRRSVGDRRVESLEDVQVAAPEPTEDPLWASVTAVQVSEAVAKLDDEFQSVYRLHAIDALSYSEISARLGIPMSTVGSRLNRARRKLRTMLESEVSARVM